ncbi:hypothetical protein ACOMHN_004005 [Nucella lapillus]
MDTLVQQLDMEPLVSFTTAETAKTAKGNERRKVKQTYAGLEVVGASADVEVTKSGVMTGGVSGNLAYSLKDDIPNPNACRRNMNEIKDVSGLVIVKRYMREERTLKYDVSNACPSSAPAQGEGGNVKIGKIPYGRDTPYCLLTQVADGQCTMSFKYAVAIDLKNTRSSTGRTAVTFNCAQDE